MPYRLDPQRVRVDFDFESALLIWGCNMKKKLLGTTAFLALVSGGPVLAADLPLKAPMLQAATVYSWTGFYVGGQIGVVTNSMSADPWSDPGFAGTVVARGDMAQTLAGIHAGYNYQFNNFLVGGVEGDLNGRFGEGFFPATDLLIRSTWDASLRARLGILVTPRTLLYGTAGVAFGNFTTAAASAPVESNFDILGGNRIGWTAGAGLQYALNGNWSTRIEYRHTDWGAKTVNWVNESGDPVVARTTLSDHRVNVGLSYKFGGPADPFAVAVAPGAMRVKAPPPAAVVASWTGFYIGGHVGASAGKTRTDTAPFTEIEDGETTTFQSTSGGFTQVLTGLHAGYNYQFSNNFVAGVEGDINAKFGGGILFKVKSRPTSDWDGSIRGRLGVLITPQSLAYVTGGFAFGNFTTPYHETDPADTVELLGGNRTGWTLGGGLEYVLDADWNTRIEYRYTDWGSKAVNWEDHAATSKLTDSRVIAGLTYKVGGKTRMASGAAVPMNWSGFYVGGQVGASAAHSQFGPNPFDTEPEFSEFTQLLAGVHAGYNYQFANILVVGVEGDLNKKFGHGFKIDDQLRPTSSWDGSIRGRVGVVVSPQGLVYFTGGYAWGNFTTPLSNADAGDLDGEHLGGSREGWTYGGGIQYALDQNLSTRIEYRHTDWGTKMTNFVFDPNPASLKDDRVAIGMSYKLGNWGTSPLVAKY